MEIGATTSSIPSVAMPSGVNRGRDQEVSHQLPLLGSGKEAASADGLPDGKLNRVDFKEAATEMFKEIKVPGDFEDRKGIDEIKDMKIGPDIRYAIKATNLDYLRRVIWGPLTIAEYREVKHRISELERQMSESSREQVESVHRKLPEFEAGAQVEFEA